MVICILCLQSMEISLFCLFNFLGEFLLRPGKATTDEMIAELLTKIIFKLCFSANNYYT